MEIKMDTMRADEYDAARFSSNEREAADVEAHRSPDATETDQFLSEPAFNGNGGHTSGQRNRGNNDIGHREGAVCRVKKELCQNVFHGVRLWMIIVIILLIIAALIILSLFVCAAIHEDVDEKFDSSLFKVPRYFNGSFRLPNFVFTEELLTPSSNKRQALAAELQNKLNDLYRSSPALGRYFSKADIQAFRSGSVMADYTLLFHLPEEELGQLRNFTLSWEMVFNVFRQFLYDQESAESGPMYIDPDSLQMYSRH
ncbi:TPA-induced transmembrane protein homolog [Parambassis ranga]|uniref:TPA-induced transmembrane protein homolog n=1 Tax=Parambassis ranga TaxID=210632 RepID=A0A6P7JGH8_9TELE|nr:TPA-induced transmembrane protein [Parambassis ranga]